MTRLLIVLIVTAALFGVCAILAAICGSELDDLVLRQLDDPPASR